MYQRNFSLNTSPDTLSGYYKLPSTIDNIYISPEKIQLDLIMQVDDCIIIYRKLRELRCVETIVVIANKCPTVLLVYFNFFNYLFTHYRNRSANLEIRMILSLDSSVNAAYQHSRLRYEQELIFSLRSFLCATWSQLTSSLHLTTVPHRFSPISNIQLTPPSTQLPTAHLGTFITHAVL